MVFRFFMALCMAYAVFAQPLPTSAVGTLAPTHEPDAPSGGSVNTCTLAALQTAMSGGGTVTFNCFGTIVFTSTWVVTANTAINGNGFGVILSGGNRCADELFDIGDTLPEFFGILFLLPFVHDSVHGEGAKSLRFGSFQQNSFEFCQFVVGEELLGGWLIQTAVLLGDKDEHGVHSTELIGVGHDSYFFWKSLALISWASYVLPLLRVQARQRIPCRASYGRRER